MCGKMSTGRFLVFWFFFFPVECCSQSRMYGSAAKAEEFLRWHPQSKTEMLCLRGSWLTIHAHPMPWPGPPTALWLLAVIGGLWPMERKAMCYRLSTIAVTLRSGSSPQLLQALEASLSCWEVMTGGSPVWLHLLPSFSKTCPRQVTKPQWEPGQRQCLLKRILRLSPIGTLAASKCRVLPQPAIPQQDSLHSSCSHEASLRL